MKRARGNGGARDKLRPEGILILGHQGSDPVIARELDLPVPSKGELLSVRVVPDDGISPSAKTFIADQYWRVASPGDPIVERRMYAGSSDPTTDRA